MTNFKTHPTRILRPARWHSCLLSQLGIAAVVAGCSSDEDSTGAPAAVSVEAIRPGDREADPLNKAPQESTSLQLRDLDLLVLMPSGEPATVVKVRFLDTALVSTASILSATGGEPDAEKLLEVLGEEKLTDSRGRVTFQTSGGPLLASASLGQLFVMQPFAPPAEDAEVLTLQLAVDSSVRARAVGRDGSPLSGIPIALTMELPAPGSDAGSRWIDLAVRETSGDDATVRFPDPRGGVQAPGGDRKPRFGLRPAIPGLEDPMPVFFDPDAPPDSPMDVAVPPLSTFVVEAVSAGGQLLDIEAEVFIEEQGATTGSRLRCSLVGGRATFTAVVPGTLLSVTVQPLDGRAAFEGVGPSALRAGDVQRISVSMESTSAEQRR